MEPSVFGALGFGPGLTAMLTLLSVTAMTSVHLYRMLRHDGGERRGGNHAIAEALEGLPDAVGREVAKEVRNALTGHLYKAAEQARERDDRERIYREARDRQLVADVKEELRDALRDHSA